jgi:hypothetical protein
MAALDHGESESLAVNGSESGDFSSLDLLVGFAGQGQ